MKTVKDTKPRLAVYKMSSCAGCQMQILNLEPVLLDILGAVEVYNFVMAKRENLPGPYDVGLVEGAITTGEEIQKLKKARRDCEVLVAFGACACTGGLPSAKNWEAQWEVERRVYPDPSLIESTKAFGIDQYVHVDAYLKGCPVNRDEMVELIKSVLLGIKPRLRTHSVCMECKLKETPCLFVNQGKACMGPVTSAGCGALCPSFGFPCEGCRGPSNDANTPSLAKVFLERGLSREEVVLKFRKFAGETPAFKRGVEAI